VGRVTALGEGAARFAVGDRVGIAWLAGTCGTCRFCRRGDENLCENALFTGWDVDGGYADEAAVDEAFAYRLPDIPDEEAAPLLCAGIVGYRALKRCNLPPGGRLGIYGFGSSAHVVAQVAVGMGAQVYAVTRSAAARELAMDLGAVWSGGEGSKPPAALDSALVFAPAGEIVPAALSHLDQGGTLVIAGIHLSDVPSLNYAEHLFGERDVRSVTAATRQDGEELLRLAARLGVTARVTAYPLEDADRALRDLSHGRIAGTAVLIP
jgi:propanol-preferring alcohol dehydrogenase